MTEQDMVGKSHCDQCHRWYPVTEKCFTVYEHNKFKVGDKILDAAILLCGSECLEKWKRGEPPALVKSDKA